MNLQLLVKYQATCGQASVHGEDKQGRQEHLDEDALLDSRDRSGAQPRPDEQRPWKERGHNSSGSDGSKDLSNGDDQSAEPANSTNEQEPERDLELD